MLLFPPTTNRTPLQVMDPASQKRKAGTDSLEGASGKRAKVCPPNLAAPHQPEYLPDRDSSLECVDAGRIMLTRYNSRKGSG